MFMISQIAVLAISQAVASGQAKPQAIPVLQIGIFSSAPDGQVRSAAYETSLSRESFQYVAGCLMGGGNRPVPDNATDAWRVSGNVQSLSADEAVIQLDWQRIRANGAAVAAPGGFVQLTLHPGDRVPLDSATVDAALQCPAKTVAFEARFGPRPFTAKAAGGGWVESPTVHAGQGTGTGSGGGTIVTNRTEVRSSANGAAVAGAGSRAPLSSQEFTANLWLVRTDPSAGPDKADFNLQGLILERVRGTADFAFSPFTIETPAGPLNVQITGNLRVTSADASGNAPQLIFTTSRTVRYLATGPNREATASSTGSSTTTNALPRPEDVVSFELPPIRVPNGDVTLPDQYSVRVRIR
jgi:hypothetical protein